MALESVQDYIKIKLVHEIHTSERRSFRACRRRWDWLFRQSYYPLVTAKPLEFGSAFHSAMEVLYDPDTWKWDREIVANAAIMKFVKVCEEQKQAALVATEQIMLDSEVEEDYNERVELGKGMLLHYAKNIQPFSDLGWKPVKVEIAFIVPVPNPETGEQVIWCKCDLCYYKFMNHEAATQVEWRGLPVVYAGRLDMLAEDKNGNYWIFDWKTAASIATNTEFLYLDDQIGSYVWALRKLGLPIRGFVYVEIRKGFPQPPKQNKTTRLGCKFSVARNQDTDYETYLKTIMAEDAEAYKAGNYNDFLEFLKNEGIVYHERHQIAKSADEIDSIEYNIGLEALDMIDPKLRIYPSAGRFGCNFCAFRQPCMEKNAHGDYQYALDTMFEQREHYYVRADASTESKGGE